MMLAVSKDTVCSDGIPVAPPIEIDGTGLLAESIYAYLQEVEGHCATCERHAKTAAIHNRGASLQLYRLFHRDGVTARQIRRATENLPSWTESLYWQKDGKSQRLWEKTKREVESRMEKHKEQHSIVTRGVAWEGMPVLVHAYKFESDPIMKVELVLAPYESPVPELSLQTIANLLQCHEHIVPEYIASALPPYMRHEAKFLTILEYLSQTMPEELYATQCLQRVSCHTSNGVGSRDTLREHQSAIASHFTHGQT